MRCKTFFSRNQKMMNYSSFMFWYLELVLQYIWEEINPQITKTTKVMACGSEPSGALSLSGSAFLVTASSASSASSTSVPWAGPSVSWSRSGPTTTEEVKEA